MSERTDNNKSCLKCKWYDPESWCCEYELRTEAILNERESANKCSYYKIGTFNYNEAEKSWEESDEFKLYFENRR